MTDERTRLSRRRLLAATAAGTGLAATPWLGGRPAMAQDKPAELIVRAWGGVWVESLEKGVSNPFTEQTGIRVTVRDGAEGSTTRKRCARSRACDARATAT